MAAAGRVATYRNRCTWKLARIEETQGSIEKHFNFNCDADHKREKKCKTPFDRIQKQSHTLLK
jgi:hypothetical protein